MPTKWPSLRKGGEMRVFPALSFSCARRIVRATRRWCGADERCLGLHTGHWGASERVYECGLKLGGTEDRASGACGEQFSKTRTGYSELGE